MKKFLVLIFLIISFVSFAQPYNGGIQSVISTANSSTSTLTSGSVFTGTSEDVSQYAEVRVAIFSDVASATDGLSLQFSNNGTNWDNTDVFTVPAGTGKNYGVGVVSKFFRVVYTNGGTNQASFRLQVIFHKLLTKPSSQRPQDARSNENDFEEVLSYPNLYNGTTWDRVRSGQQPGYASQAVTLSSQNVLDSFVTGQSAQTATVNNILTATAGTNATDLLGYRSYSVQVVSTGSAGAFIFEGSNDNVNFFSVPSVRIVDVNGSVYSGSITVASSSFVYTGALNFRYLRLRISTTVTGGSIQAFSKFSQTPYTPIYTVVTQVTATNLNTAVGSVVSGTGATNLGKAEDAASANGDSGPAVMVLRNDALTANTSTTGDYQVPVGDTYGALIVKDQQRHKRTYRMAFVVAPAASATDVFQLIGSASTTVEVTKLIVSGTQTTGGMNDLYISKRSTANTGGTSTSATAVVLLSTDAAATAVGTIYTANPTTGTPVGDIYVASLAFSGITGTTPNIYEINFGERGKPVLLSGVAQALAIRLNGATIGGGSLKITVEFTEY